MNFGREERRSFGLPMLRNKNDETVGSSPEAPSLVELCQIARGYSYSCSLVVSEELAGILSSTTVVEKSRLSGRHDQREEPIIWKSASELAVRPRARGATSTNRSNTWLKQKSSASMRSGAQRHGVRTRLHRSPISPREQAVSGLAPASCKSVPGCPR